MIRKKNVKGELVVRPLGTASVTMVGTSKPKHWNKESQNYIFKSYRNSQRTKIHHAAFVTSPVRAQESTPVVMPLTPS